MRKVTGEYPEGNFRGVFRKKGLKRGRIKPWLRATHPLILRRSATLQTHFNFNTARRENIRHFTCLTCRFCIEIFEVVASNPFETDTVSAMQERKVHRRLRRSILIASLEHGTGSICFRCFACSTHISCSTSRWSTGSYAFWKCSKSASASRSRLVQGTETECHCTLHPSCKFSRHLFGRFGCMADVDDLQCII